MWAKWLVCDDLDPRGFLSGFDWELWRGSVQMSYTLFTAVWRCEQPPVEEGRGRSRVLPVTGRKGDRRPPVRHLWAAPSVVKSAAVGGLLWDESRVVFVPCRRRRRSGIFPLPSDGDAFAFCEWCFVADCSVCLWGYFCFVTLLPGVVSFFSLVACGS